MGKEIQKLAVDSLHVHPRNTEFFDDISGEEYERFKESIKNEGILSPIIITPDMTIISGHQRAKAAKDIGIALVPVIIREDLSDESAKLKALIAANFGRTKNDAAKQRKAIVEYVDLCGVSHGGDRKSRGLEDPLKLSFDEIAKQFDISKKSLKRALSIERNLSEDMKELLDTGVISKNLAADVISSLTMEEQDELIEKLGIASRISADKTEKIKNDEVKKYIDEIRQLKSDNHNSKIESQNKISSLERKIRDFESSARVTSDEINDLRRQKNILERKVKMNEDELRKFNNLKTEIQSLTQRRDDILCKIDAATELSEFVLEMRDLLETKLAPIKFKKCIDVLGEFATSNEILHNILEQHKSWLLELEQIYNSKTGEIIDI